MRCSLLGMISVVVMAASLVGCMTQGENTLERTVYDTHRRVSALDKNLQSSVDKLGQTSADLATKTDATDQNVKTLQATVEENSRKLSDLEKKLESLTRALNRAASPTMAPPPPSNAPNEVKTEQPVTINKQ